MASSEPSGQAEGQTTDEENSDDGDGDASSTRDESIKATNKPSDYERTPLHLAASRGPVEVVKFLTEHGADIHKTDQYERTPLHLAADKGHFEVVKFLTEHGADIHKTDQFERTPLHLAASRGQVEIVKFLTEHGADIHKTDKGGWTALHFGARSGEVEVIKYLLEKGLDVNQTNNNERTPLHLAALRGQVEVVKFLTEHGADIHKTDEGGWTALHFGAISDEVEVIKYLLEKGLDVNQTSNDGDTPLHTAAYQRNVKAVKFLTEHGADIYKTNQEGETPLLKAVHWDEGNVVRYLIHKCKMEITQLDQETQSKIKKMLEEENGSKTEIDGDDNTTSHAENGADDNNEDMQRAYTMALKDGEAQSSSVSIYILGQQSAGKTCLVASLLGDKFEENAATQGADIEVCTIFASQWSRVEKKKVPKQLQRRYLGKLKVTAEIKITAERQQSVSKAQNKQELLESLPQLPQAVKEDLEQAKTAVLIDEDGINAIIWDFAGQSVYYGLHSMFLKEDNVAMIVFDASQSLQDPAKGRSGLKDPYTQQSINPLTTGYESVCYWLNSVHSICRKDGSALGAKSKLVPTVFLVATHIDLIGDDDAVSKRRREIIDQLFFLLRGKPFAKHLAGIEDGIREALEKNCFFISNKVRDQKELNRLRAMLVKASEYIANKQHPVVYLNIEKRLLSLTEMVISVVKFCDIAKDSGFLADRQSAEMKGALEHFHRKGTILHFPQAESLKDVVVLSPDWLTKLFAYIIIAHPYKTECDYFLHYDRLKNQGVLEEDFVAYMVKKFNKEQEKFGLPLTAKQAIEFAELFGFITEVNTNTYFLEEAEQPPASKNKVFIVPPMLPLHLPDDVQLPKDSDLQVRAVYFKFSEGFIPPMIYYQMLGACIDRNIKRKEDLYWIRRHMIKLVLGRDQLYYVSLCEDDDSIRLAITPDKNITLTPLSYQERWNLIEYFNTKLMEIVKTFMPASHPPLRYIPCSNCSKLHLKLDDIRESDRPLHCVHGRLEEDYYSDLRTYQEADILDNTTVVGDMKSILKQEPKLKQLVSYLRKLFDWETFGTLLLPDEEEYLVEEIKVDNEGKGVKSCKMALYRTFLKCGVKTWETVINALEESDNEDIAKDLKTNLLKNLGGTA